MQADIIQDYSAQLTRFTSSSFKSCPKTIAFEIIEFIDTNSSVFTHEVPRSLIRAVILVSKFRAHRMKNLHR